jgi:hypothetical protein
MALSGPLRSPLERGFSGAAHGIHKLPLATLSPSPQLDLCCCFCFFFSFFSFFFYLCYLSYCFPFWETIVFEIVLVSLFHAVLFLYSNNFFTVPTIFWWLLQVSSKDVVGLALICFSFTFETALCSPLK